MAGSDEDDFLSLLDEYLEPPHDQNRAMSNVRIVWVDDDPRLGTLHIAEHGIAKAEVEQVLFELPPVVEAKRSRENPERTLFPARTLSERCSGEPLVTTAGSSSLVKTGRRVPFAT